MIQVSDFLASVDDITSQEKGNIGEGSDYRRKIRFRYV